MKLKTKKFDCVEMKRICQEKAEARIAGLTPTQKLAYWGRIYKDMVRRQKALRAKTKA